MMTDQRPSWEGLLDPRFLIALIVIGLFGWALSDNLDDDTMKGALIAGFAGAWGYYLGSSRGTSEANARTDKVLEVAAAGAATPALKVDPDAKVDTVKHPDGSTTQIVTAPDAPPPPALDTPEVAPWEK